jgi:choice-of-anchor A domain-containing protein
MRRPVLPARRVPSLIAAAFLAGAPVAASATTLTATSIISQFNLVASSNVSTQHDVEGSAVIGGNLSGGTFFNNRVPTNPVLYLYGAQSGTTTLDTGKFDYGSITGSVNLNGGATKQQGGWTDPASAYFSLLNNYSTQLSKMLAQSNNTESVNSGTLTFSANAADADGVAVFDLTASALSGLFSSASNIKFTLGTGVKTIVINVDGNFTQPGGMNMNGADQEVLFNFYDATALSLGAWETSVLAPNSATTTGGAFEGFLYTKTLTAGGELHNLAINTPLPPPVGVPEPGTIALVGAGLAAVIASRRARRSRTG